MRRLWYVMWKELLELRQDPRLFGIIFMAPVIQLTMLGYAATTDVKNVPIVVVDQDGTPASRQLISRFDASPYFTVVATLPSIRDVDPWLERGNAWMALAIPADYHTGIDAGRPVTVQVIADGTDSNSAGVAMGYAAEPRRRLQPGPGPRAAAGGGQERAAVGHRGAHPRLVQPAAREPPLHDPRHRRAAAAGDHDEPVVDGGRAREGAGHARAAQRHARHALAAHRRQAAAVRRDRHHRRHPGDHGRRHVVQDPAARQPAAAVCDELHLPADDARAWGCSSRRSRTRSSRRR